MKEFPKRFLSLRDKHGGHARGKPIPSGSKGKSSHSDNIRSLFRTDRSKDHADEVEEGDEDADKIAQVQTRLDDLNIDNITIDHIKDILSTPSAGGDPSIAAALIDIERKSASGVIANYNPNIHMLGAENRGAVTCYLDALLFSMFSKLDAFECMLQNEFPPDDPRTRLVNLLRIWVNMLRTGLFIRTDLTKLIQEALADCGWSDARMLEQQDTSEAFAFLTETLQLPLLSLQVDLFHHGKGDKDDHKVVYERLLNLAVPPDPEGKGIKLEDCLEEYFNTQVDVMRDSEEAKKSVAEEGGAMKRRSTLVSRNTIRLLSDAQGQSSTAMSASPITSSPITPIPPELIEKSLNGVPSPSAISPSTVSPGAVSLTANAPTTSSPTETSAPVPGTATENGGSHQDAAEEPTPSAVRRLSARNRSTSIIQNMVLDEKGRSSSVDSATMLQRARRKGSTVVKAVTIPAWQFFRLIPWHALARNDPETNSDVATNFDQKPVVGICLKRYAMTETGLPKRHNTYIDIPDSLRLPHFMLADDESEEDPDKLNMDYKMVLQSIVCHRGDSLQSGHYISFARVAPKVLTGNRRHNFDPPPDYEEARWVQFDDLETDRRVRYVDDIRKALREEMPYLLFYQVVPMVDAAASTDNGDTEPPSYTESKNSMELPGTPSVPDDSLIGTAAHESYFDKLSNVALTQSPARLGKPPSIRLSLDGERRPVKTFDPTQPASQPGSIWGDSRRPSINPTDSAVVTPAITPDRNSPIISPSDESTAARLSRAASRFTKSRHSRPNSQSGEGGRLSFSMNRLVGSMKPSKDQLSVEQNTLPTSPGSSAALEDLEKERSAPPLLENDHFHLNDPPTPHKHSHGKGKGKEKSGKTKHHSQPDRECSVM